MRLSSLVTAFVFASVFETQASIISRITADTLEANRVPTHESPRSLFVTLARDGDNGWQMRDQQSQYTWFDLYGRIFARSDRFADPRTVNVGGTNGNVIRYLYDAQGRLSQIVDPVGRVTLLRYWAEDETGAGGYPNYLREIEDWCGRKVNYEYDDRGRLRTVLLPRVKAGETVPAELDRQLGIRLDDLTSDGYGLTNAIGDFRANALPRPARAVSARTRNIEPRAFR